MGLKKSPSFARITNKKKDFLWFSECENSGVVRQPENAFPGGVSVLESQRRKNGNVLVRFRGRYRSSEISDFRKQEFQRRVYPQVPEQEGLLTIEKNWRRGCRGTWDELLERESVGPNAQASVDLPINPHGSKPVSSIFRKNHDPRIRLGALVTAAYFFRKPELSLRTPGLVRSDGLAGFGYNNGRAA